MLALVVLALVVLVLVVLVLVVLVPVVLVLLVMVGLVLNSAFANCTDRAKFALSFCCCFNTLFDIFFD